MRIFIFMDGYLPVYVVSHIHFLKTLQNKVSLHGLGVQWLSGRVLD